MYAISTIGFLGDSSEPAPCPPGATCRDPIDFHRDPPVAPQAVTAHLDVPTLAIVAGVGALLGGAAVFFLTR